MDRGFILPLLAVLLIIVVLAGVYGMIVWKWSYSEGERAGVVQKFRVRAGSARRGRRAEHGGATRRAAGEILLHGLG